ncbi:MAG TPA: ABC transporter ATP-binding protein [bacterium]|nr:ABC transporter ATP-binding protein [bacterium]
MSSPAIVCDGLSMTFDQGDTPLSVLQEISLTVAEGEFLTLLGPSGCGKSTLLRLLADILAPTRGAITILGHSPNQARRDRALGMVFQQPVLLPWLSVEENIALPLRIGRWGARHPGGPDPASLVKLVGLEGFERSRPAQLSGGMQQRVAIARALVNDSPVLLMDEPFGALDAITRDRLNEELLRIWTETKRTVVFVTHSIPEAVYLSTRVAVFSPRPARIRRLIEIDLPFPRHPKMRDTPHFTQFAAALREALEQA